MVKLLSDSHFLDALKENLEEIRLLGGPEDPGLLHIPQEKLVSRAGLEPATHCLKVLGLRVSTLWPGVSSRRQRHKFRSILVDSCFLRISQNQCPIPYCDSLISTAFLISTPREQMMRLPSTERSKAPIRLSLK